MGSKGFSEFVIFVKDFWFDGLDAGLCQESGLLRFRGLQSADHFDELPVLVPAGDIREALGLVAEVFRLDRDVHEVDRGLPCVVLVFAGEGAELVSLLDALVGRLDLAGSDGHEFQIVQLVGVCLVPCGGGRLLVVVEVVQGVVVDAAGLCDGEGRPFSPELVDGVPDRDAVAMQETGDRVQLQDVFLQSG
ncbi:MAG: hypothetical protein IJ271_05375 [Bacteroidales bacterium]|nr:hypothetical protein [Bacteroidales bacterium]